MLKGLPVFSVSFIVGSIAAYIAYRQYRVSRGKFMLDLFEKRLEIFLYTADFLSRGMDSSQREVNAIPIFRGQTAAADFLFKPDIAAFLKEVTEKATQPRERRAEVELWAEEQMRTLHERFKPYMNLSAWR